MPCLVANCAVVNSPRSASNATFALKSAEYRFRLLVIQVRLSQKRTELNHLSEFRGPAHTSVFFLLPVAGLHSGSQALYDSGRETNGGQQPHGIRPIFLESNSGQSPARDLP